MRVAEKKPKRQVKARESVREQSARKANSPNKPRKVTRVVKTAGKPLGAAKRVSKKEYHPLNMPDTKVGRFLNRRVRFFPRYFTDAWTELKLVTWPSRRETARMTTAVVIFAVAFGGIVYGLDYGLDKLFRQLLLG